MKMIERKNVQKFIKEAKECGSEENLKIIFEQFVRENENSGLDFEKINKENKFIEDIFGK